MYKLNKTIKIVLLLIFVGGCPKPPVPGSLYGPARNPAELTYSKVLNTWTRATQIYQKLDTKAFITSTFHAPEFRSVFAREFPDIYGHGGEVTRRELKELSGNIEQHLNFFVAMYTPREKWNDLAKPESIWRIRLKGQHQVSVAPTEVIKVSIDANLRAVYPYLSRFDQAYIVRFPLTDRLERLVIPPISTGFTMEIASALGRAVLDWQLIPQEYQ